MKHLTSDYSKNLLISVFGVGAAAIIPLLARPFLGRMFTPEEFNVMGLYLASVAILGVLGNLRYGYAVAVAKTDEEALNLLGGSIALSFFISLLLTLLIYIFDGMIVEAFHLDKNLLRFSFLIPAGVFSASVCIAINGWLNRKKKFTAMAVNKIVRRGAESIIHLIFGKIRLSGGLILGAFLGDMVNLFIHFFQFKQSKHRLSKLKSAAIIKSLKEYADYPKHNLIPSLLNIASLYLPIFILNSKYEKDICGQFFQSRDLLVVPLALTTATLSQVLLQKLTELRDQNKLAFPFLRKNFLMLTVIAAVGSVIVIPFGEIIFEIFLGDQWSLAGKMSSVMVIAYAVKFIVSPLSQVFYVYDKLKIASYFQYFYFVLICALWVFPKMDIFTFLWIFVLVETIPYIFYGYLIFMVTKQADQQFTSVKQ